MIEKLKHLCTAATPFLFFTDFEGKSIRCYAIAELEEEAIEFTFEGNGKPHNAVLKSFPIDYDAYREKLQTVQEYIRRGETYLLNLTQPTPVETSLNLQKIFAIANAPYKLRYKNEFVCFSPEKFIEIIDNKIYTYPMKGTIDASIKNAKNTILNDRKEMAEHIMVVDLLRNDIGIVANNIKVEKFRYVDKIRAGEKELLQVSSKISGELRADWLNTFPQMLRKLLPAGSISGTPKKRTVEIIKEVEGYSRGYFSGVFGYFDGRNLYSAVMIRYIENKDGQYIYKSGGGITIDSDAKSEYAELIAKIYIP